jgi:hypothetical protein
MRYEPEHKAQTRDRIVRNAARKLRTEGLKGPGVAGVMKASGLEFRSHGILAKAVGILVVAGTGETPSQYCRSLKSLCFPTATRNVDQKRCSNWRDGNEPTR